MRELDALTLIMLEQTNPERAVCHGNHTLLHAKCANKYRGRLIKFAANGYRMATMMYLPVGTDIATWGNGCAQCGRKVYTQDLEPLQ